MYDNTTLPKSVLQVAVLVTGTHLRAQYTIYGHEHLAQDAGVPTTKIATIVAGERPTDLTRDEAIAYDIAAALNRFERQLRSNYAFQEDRRIAKDVHPCV